MKKILITGKNSYVGTSFKEWVSQDPDKYEVHSISVRGDSWREISFSEYDVIIHTAALVHKRGVEPKKYSKINRDLTIELAQKAKKEGVKQFIFLSTMGVYGVETGIITENTKPNPKTPYAMSKFEAEKLLLNLQSSSFKIVVLRPPIIYGKNCPGNYTRLSRVAKLTPIFPVVENKRSMIFIDNLSECIRLIIDNNQSGIFFPQNKEYVNTTKLIINISKSHGKVLKTTRLFNIFIKLGMKFSGTFRKVFGTFVYDEELSFNSNGITKELINYETVSFEESIIKTEQ